MPSFNPTNYNQIQRPCVIQSVLNLCSKGLITEAVKSLDNLASKGLRLDTKSLAFLLKQCANNRLIKEGKWVHLHMNVTGRKRPGTFLCNQLIHMYSECGDSVGARKVFDEMPVRNLYSWNSMLSGYAKLRMMEPARTLFDRMGEKDVVSWNTMVIGYAHNEDFNEALRFYKELKMLKIGLNEFSFAGVLTVCVKRKDLELTRQVHGQVFGFGFLSSLVLCSSMIDCYVKCGEMSDARKLFDEMPKRDVVSWTTLISGYAKWGDMNTARQLFDDMPKKNPVSCNAMISGYARNGFGHEALELFTEMMVKRVKPDQFTFSSALCACASIPSIKNGKQIHGFLIKTHFKPNTIVVSSLIDMYSKCGNLALADRVFKLTSDKTNTILWNTMISALAQHGHGESAMNVFSDMVNSQVKLDRITFVVILNACSHSGLVKDGLNTFNTMMHEHNVIPDEEHYACLIDLLGRAGCFDEVVNQLRTMPVKPDARVWKSLLGICRIHGNLDLGIKAAERLIELEPRSSVGYVLLSGMYAASGRWEHVSKVRKLMNERDVRKERGVSWLEDGNKLHAFAVSDKSHILKDELESVLEILSIQMEDDELMMTPFSDA
ncbi:putative tetratricopeptide-like helical domain superfamily [Helianthus annuus]|uniref:Putative pentatricopeptide repeat (PPR-like) superfamily protein n=1 Tax=Helianthus annuus TaxID=4232 RepID=A0A251RQY8_HELAN|nr:pentatricopeptide repeat-containing protein At2g21090 [Helianthus annuus]KAF5755704.1 putative tetratricopeptide-like helical domain superfamily [Helianthus annuus]KAJ0429353.1 putative tetratricopeptide-like helical domain superfamily [Helianthus annuus]KAJ0636529.1 putative tetratricopeptide-like helical domain superfamily [Helianthus annuus]